MQWVSMMLTIIGLLAKYGPTLWKLGVEAYGIVESIITAFKGHVPKPSQQEVKTLADAKFDQTLVRLAEARQLPVPAPVTRTQLRRDVWATRPVNFKKVREGGRKPT